jgi:hypothetical protein
MVRKPDQMGLCGRRLDGVSSIRAAISGDSVGFVGETEGRGYDNDCGWSWDGDILRDSMEAYECDVVGDSCAIMFYPCCARYFDIVAEEMA